MLKRNYLILLLLFLLFAAPGIAAYLFYLNPQWLSASTTNKGRLLKPPVTLLRSKGGKPQWTLMLWAPQGCEQACLKQLDKLARIRLALGRRLYDVEELLLATKDQVFSANFRNSLQEQAIHLLQINPTNLKEALTTQSEIFIANPDGLLILAYSPEANPADIYHDLKHLLNTTEKKSG